MVILGIRRRQASQKSLAALAPEPATGSCLFTGLPASDVIGSRRIYHKQPRLPRIGAVLSRRSGGRQPGIAVLGRRVALDAGIFSACAFSDWLILAPIVCFARRLHE